MFDSIGVPASSLPFIEESSYALTTEHILDMYKLCALSSQQELRRTGDEVGASTMFGPSITSLQPIISFEVIADSAFSKVLTPILQALDEQYQDCDFDFGGLDQVSEASP